MSAAMYSEAMYSEATHSEAIYSGPMYSDIAAARPKAHVGRIALRCAGGKPLRFDGDLLAEGSSQTPFCGQWHEIQIFERDSGGYVLGLRLCRVAGGGYGNAGAGTMGIAAGSTTSGGADRALGFDDFDSLAGWLERFDPAGDLHAGFDVSDPLAPGAEIALKAAAFRDRAELLRSSFRALVGELLYRIETEV